MVANALGGYAVIVACLSPIQDMFSIIDAKGPDTERIFRTLANKPYLTLREKLDSAEEMNLREESVYIVASVLKVEKDFIVITSSSTYKQLQFISNLLPWEKW